MAFRETLQKVYISGRAAAADYERAKLRHGAARVVDRRCVSRGRGCDRPAVGAVGDINAVVLCKTRVVEI